MARIEFEKPAASRRGGGAIGGSGKIPKSPKKSATDSVESGLGGLSSIAPKGGKPKTDVDWDDSPWCFDKIISPRIPHPDFKIFLWPLPNPARLFDGGKARTQNKIINGCLAWLLPYDELLRGDDLAVIGNAQICGGGPEKLPP